MQFTESQSKWFLLPKPNHNARLRLFCLPFAGGSADIYKSWESQLHESIELVAIQLPGRGARFIESPIAEMDLLVEELWRELKLYTNKPYALFGHSLGAKVGFALMQHIRKEGGLLPLHFFASASVAPHLPSRPPLLHQQNDQMLVESLREYGGTPEEVLDNDELMALLFPVLRADFYLAETYFASIGDPLDVGLSTFGGESDDKVLASDLTAWAEHFAGDQAVLKLFSGGHFFIESHTDDLIAQINSVLSRLLVSTKQT